MAAFAHMPETNSASISAPHTASSDTVTHRILPFGMRDNFCYPAFASMQATGGATASDAVEVLISYSHRDDKLREALETHLSLLRRQGFISVWQDRRISAGAEWKEQINAHLDSAQVILLLVSPDFLASDYCYEVEVKRAIERHDVGTARVIPVILRSVDWHDAPFGKLQALPKDGKPILRWSDRDEAFRTVVAGIRGAVQELRAGTSLPVSPAVVSDDGLPARDDLHSKEIDQLRAGINEIELLWMSTWKERDVTVDPVHRLRLERQQEGLDQKREELLKHLKLLEDKQLAARL